LTFFPSESDQVHSHSCNKRLKHLVSPSAVNAGHDSVNNSFSQHKHNLYHWKKKSATRKEITFLLAHPTVHANCNKQYVKDSEKLPSQAKHSIHNTVVQPVTKAGSKFFLSNAAGHYPFFHTPRCHLYEAARAICVCPGNFWSLESCTVTKLRKSSILAMAS